MNQLTLFWYCQINLSGLYAYSSPHLCKLNLEFVNINCFNYNSKLLFLYLKTRLFSLCFCCNSLSRSVKAVCLSSNLSFCFWKNAILWVPHSVFKLFIGILFNKYFKVWLQVVFPVIRCIQLHELIYVLNWLLIVLTCFNTVFCLTQKGVVKSTDSVSKKPCKLEMMTKLTAVREAGFQYNIFQKPVNLISIGHLDSIQFFFFKSLWGLTYWISFSACYLYTRIEKLIS